MLDTVMPATSAGDHMDRRLISIVVHAFYRNIRHDDLLGPIFDAHVEDWHAHEARLVGFWSSVLLGTGEYHGSPLSLHASMPGLDSRHFARWLWLFEQTLSAHCQSHHAMAFRSRAERIARAFQAARQPVAMAARPLGAGRSQARNAMLLDGKETGERQ